MAQTLAAADVPGTPGADLVPAPAPEAEPASPGEAAESGGHGEPELDPHATACVNYIGSLLGQLCNHPHMQSVWSLSLPLDPELLWNTVLHLRYCPTQLTLEFASPDWATRELLRPHLGRFQQQLQALVNPSCEVWVSV